VLPPPLDEHLGLEQRVEGFPAHVVAAWLGHTVKVANAYYNQVTDEHFRRAVDPDGKKEPPAHGAA